MRHFIRDDFETYRSWYANPDLNRELGPIDTEWLEHVMSETPVRQFSFVEKNVLIAVIGTEGPKPDETSHYITDIAVDPSRKRNGIATRALNLLIENHREIPSPPESWIAWVDADNDIALRFFHRSGWQRSSHPDDDNMFQLTLETKPCSE